MSVPLLVPRREWWCPYCTVMTVTERPGLHVEFHHCRGMAGLWAPMFERGERGHLVVTEREDYQGRDKVTRNADGRPIMRAEKLVGNDQRAVVVYAPAGQRRLELDDVAESVPRPVRRKGASTMRRWLQVRLTARPPTKER